MSESGKEDKSPKGKARKSRKKKPAGKAKKGKLPIPAPLLIASLNHRRRREILRYYHDKGTPLSPVMVCEAFGVELSAVSYHIVILRTSGALRKVREEPARGAVEHFYASTVSKCETTLTLLEESKKDDEREAKKEGR